MARGGIGLGGSLHYELERRDGITWISLVGDITEASDLSPLIGLRGPVIINLSKVSRINSLGVRLWLDFVQDCEKAGNDLIFEACSPVMVSQMSVISNFMGARSRVKSVLVPYLCPSCKHEQLEVLAVANGARVRGEIPCGKCGAAMELDELPDTYRTLLPAP